MKIGLALGGGVVYGCAHIGVIRVLEKNGIKPDIITGTSIGSLIGGAYASGLKVDEIERMATELKWQEILSMTLPTEGLVSPDKMKQFINRNFKKENIEDAPIKYAAVATNLITNTERIFDSGLFSDAIRASCSIPGIFTPAVYNDGIYVDGGLVNNVPITVCKALGADFIIGVDVTANAKSNIIKNQDIFNIVWQSFMLMINETARLKNSGEADYIIKPDIRSFSPFDLTQAERLIRKGEETAEKMVAEIAASIQEKGTLLGKVKDMLKMDDKER
ncbi:MAG: patatin-like phospholipase family protein [Spirochaetia bacterium]|nr:patatin-like phospholipase family protein [Spirochaetia bacterium]